jgi:hypothetical protein
MSTLGKGGNGVHITDCFIWSEIYYLDSPTDYREYLPQPHVRLSAALDDELVTLDSTTTMTYRHFLWPMAFLVLIVTMACLLWYVLSNL